MCLYILMAFIGAYRIDGNSFIYLHKTLNVLINLNNKIIAEIEYDVCFLK